MNKIGYCFGLWLCGFGFDFGVGFDKHFIRCNHRASNNTNSMHRLEESPGAEKERKIRRRKKKKKEVIGKRKMCRMANIKHT